MPRRALTDITSESTFGRKTKKSTLIPKDKENIVYEDLNFSKPNSIYYRNKNGNGYQFGEVPQYRIIPPSPKISPILKGNGTSSSGGSSKKKVQFGKHCSQSIVSTPVKKRYSTPTKFPRQTLIFEDSVESNFSSPGEVFEDFKRKLSFANTPSKLKLIQRLQGSALPLGTPKGKKTMTFDTPVKKRVLKSGLHGLSPTTKKQIHHLGEGSFGRVVVGKYKGSKRALKVLKPTGLTREALALHLDHPNIIKTVDVHESSSNSDYVIVVMEFVGTDTLQTFIDSQETPLRVQQCAKFAKEISDALCYCHEQKLIHMDVKPSNIVVTPPGVCKLTDFGSCINLNEDISEAKEKKRGISTEGTIPYTAPEIFRGSSPTSAADIYSVGIVMHQMWTGSNPYSEVDSAEALIYQVVSQKRRPEAKREPQNHHERYYTSLYEKCWRVEPQQRPSAGIIKRGCEEISQDRR